MAIIFDLPDEVFKLIFEYLVTVEFASLEVRPFAGLDARMECEISTACNLRLPPDQTAKSWIFGTLEVPRNPINSGAEGQLNTRTDQNCGANMKFLNVWPIISRTRLPKLHYVSDIISHSPSKSFKRLDESEIYALFDWVFDHPTNTKYTYENLE
ncbi:hypothetical protein PtA15_7A351 [Puccinia triticina]|uniref:F-box domain-containing protein n=1 Tax=Puccinia triticina TaxID=208348 RepID=A0ABY7CN27_9BASI|nr:uncharacterized protein PtA15_7A351 [Puccinia triticina]WAQ86624.1 hypothetical protein PtA15_7A351 [Puccinia triticina]